MKRLALFIAIITGMVVSGCGRYAARMDISPKGAKAHAYYRANFEIKDKMQVERIPHDRHGWDPVWAHETALPIHPGGEEIIKFDRYEVEYIVRPGSNPPLLLEAVRYSIDGEPSIPVKPWRYNNINLYVFKIKNFQDGAWHTIRVEQLYMKNPYYPESPNEEQKYEEFYFNVLFCSSNSNSDCFWEPNW